MTRKYSRKRSRTRRIRTKRSKSKKVTKRPRTKRMRTKRHYKQLGGSEYARTCGTHMVVMDGQRNIHRQRINSDINKRHRQRREKEADLQKRERRSNLTMGGKIKDSFFSCCGALPTQTQSDGALDTAIARREDRNAGKKVPY